MLQEAYTQIMTQLRDENLSQVDKLSLIQQLDDDYKTVLAEQATTKEKIDNLTSENVKYAKLNNELFLKSAASFEGINTNNTTPPGGADGNQPPVKMTFEDLYAKMGKEVK